MLFRGLDPISIPDYLARSVREYRNTLMIFNIMHATSLRLYYGLASGLDYLLARSSTSNSSTASGGMTPPAPREP